MGCKAAPPSSHLVQVPTPVLRASVPGWSFLLVLLLSPPLLLLPSLPFTLAFSFFSSSPLPADPDVSSSVLLSESLHPLVPLSRIPKVVHFVYGFREPPHLSFDLDDFVAVKSALDVLGAEKVLIWLLNTPQSEWWEAMLAMGRKRAQALHLTVDSVIELKPIRDVVEVFGRRVESSAHKADVVRMEALLTYGGIYMDIDVVALKPMDDLINAGWPCILGQERTADGTHPHGLGNAYMLIAKGSPFLYEWYTGYRKFDWHQWASLSVHLPIRLSRALPEYCLELEPHAFYFPSFDESGKKEMYEGNSYDLSRNYAVHLWSGGKKFRAPQKTFADLCALNNTWGRIARTVLLAGEGNANICNGRGVD